MNRELPSPPLAGLDHETNFASHSREPAFQEIMEGEGVFSLTLEPTSVELPPPTEYSAAFGQLISRIKQGSINCVFVQPHFDDNVLSAGGLIKDLVSTRVPVKGVTVMSSVSGLVTDTTQASLIKRGLPDADTYQRIRLHENKLANRVVGLRDAVVLGQLDCPWRNAQYSDVHARILPTDERLHEIIAGQLKEAIGPNRPTVVFSPAGVGRHIDHLIVRDACSAAFKDNPNMLIVYYAEFPYTVREEFLSDTGLPTFLSREKLGLAPFSGKQDSRIHAIYEYSSQLASLFKRLQKPGGAYTFNMPAEGYFVNINKISQFLAA